MLTDEERARARTMVVENPLSEAVAAGRIGRATSGLLPKGAVEEYMPTVLVDGGRHAKLNPLGATTVANPLTAGAMRLFRTPPGTGIYGEPDAVDSGETTI